MSKPIIYICIPRENHTDIAAKTHAYQWESHFMNLGYEVVNP